MLRDNSEVPLGVDTDNSIITLQHMCMYTILLQQSAKSGEKPLHSDFHTAIVVKQTQPEFNPLNAVSIYRDQRNRPHFFNLKKILTADLASLFLD